MARIRKPTSTEPRASSEVDPETGDDLRRFIEHASDMIAAQEAVRASLADATAALDKAVKGGIYNILYYAHVLFAQAAVIQ